VALPRGKPIGRDKKKFSLVNELTFPAPVLLREKRKKSRSEGLNFTPERRLAVTGREV
jgi:hypothetical protein